MGPVQCFPCDQWSRVKLDYIMWGWRLGVRAEICTSGVQNDEQKMRREISPRQGKRRKKDGD